MKGINIPLLEKRFKFFTRTLIGSITTIARHNPEAAALFIDVGEVTEKIIGLIEFIKAQNEVLPTPAVKPKK